MTYRRDTKSSSISDLSIVLNTGLVDRRVPHDLQA